MRRPAILLFLLLAAVEARADYKDSYRKGMEALDRKRWDEVARYMREAIGENPTEGERIKLYGLRFETYLPHFHLGAAYLNLGNCDLATKSFETSRTQGAIRSHPKWPELLDGLKSCEGSGPAPKPPSPSAAPTTTPTTTMKAGPDAAQVAQAVQAAEGALSGAEESGRAVTQLAADPRLSAVWSREPDLGRAEAEGREALAAARARLDAGRRGSDLGLLGDAREQATRARERLERVRSAAERKRESLQPTPAPAPPTTTLKAAEGVTPADLMAGAQAYFAGRYDEAVRLLEPSVGLRGRAGVQAKLLRAAARHALYRAGGEKDAVLRRQAADDVTACRRADPSLVPDSAAFSPQFLDFFRSN
jgi:tetratricopeptide (TPR) repeat protein